MKTSFYQLRQKYVVGLGAEPILSCKALQQRRVCKRQNLIDLLVTVSSLGPALFRTEQPINPLLEKAIVETNPNLDTSQLSYYSNEQLIGIINSAKGKYFEYQVTEKLNAGEAVGDLQLPDGYRAVMADSATQPGWDIQILDSNGYVSDYLQLKATSSAGYIYDTLDRYPDISILSTSEVAGHVDGIVLDSGITEASLRSDVMETLDQLDTSFSSSFMDAFNPLFPLTFILATEGYRLIVGKSSTANLVESMQRRVERSIVSSGVGAVVYALGGGLLAIPATMIGGEIYNNFQKDKLIIDKVKQATDSLTTFRLYQQQRILEGF